MHSYQKLHGEYKNSKGNLQNSTSWHCMKFLLNYHEQFFDAMHLFSIGNNQKLLKFHLGDFFGHVLNNNFPS